MKLLIGPHFFPTRVAVVQKHLEPGEAFTSRLETPAVGVIGALGVGEGLPDEHCQHSFYVFLDCPRGFCSDTLLCLGRTFS